MKIMNMNIRKIIKKYIFLIIPLLILLSNGLILNIFDGDYSSLSDNMTAFYGIMIVFTVSPVVCLIIEIMGFVRAVGCYREIDEDEPYSIKRKGIGYVILHGGAILMTIVWFCAMLYISYQFLSRR
jgi:hypothetical protein